MNVLVDEARKWIGTRWQHQARLKGVGVDCAGLIIGVARATLAVPAETIDAIERTVSGYDRSPSGLVIQRMCEQSMVHIDINAVAPGDVALFRFNAEPQHLGFISDYPGGLGLIHAFALARKVVEHRFDSVWRGRCIACYRIG